MGLVKTFGGCAIIAAAALGAGAAHAEIIELEIAGVRSAKGAIKIDVYAPPRKHAAKRLVPAIRGPMKVAIDDVRPGAYAIMLYHDENGNGRLDRGGLLGMPIEGYAFSNDAPVRFGPPSFNAMKVEVKAKAGLRTSVRMRYP